MLSLPHRLPSVSSLIAFDTAVRLGSFSRAARELRTSQPTISFKVGRLEKQFSVRLLERAHSGVTLTPVGERFHAGVSVGLNLIRAAVAELAASPGGEQVVIACSHDASHFFVLPRYARLRQALGEDVGIRILTYHYELRNLPREPVATSFSAGSGPSAPTIPWSSTVRRCGRSARRVMPMPTGRS